MRRVARIIPIICLSLPAQAADWDVLGGDEGCVSHSEACVATVATRYGDVVIAATEDGSSFELSANAESLATLMGYSVNFENIYSAGDADDVLISVNSGGMACPMSLHIVELRQEGPPVLSPEFGTCSDYYRAEVDDGELLVRMPDYANPMHANDQDQADSGTPANDGITIFRWRDGVLSRDVETD